MAHSYVECVLYHVGRFKEIVEEEKHKFLLKMFPCVCLLSEWMKMMKKYNRKGKKADEEINKA